MKKIAPVEDALEPAAEARNVERPQGKPVTAPKAPQRSLAPDHEGTPTASAPGGFARARSEGIDPEQVIELVTIPADVIRAGASVARDGRWAVSALRALAEQQEARSAVRTNALADAIGENNLKIARLLESASSSSAAEQEIAAKRAAADEAFATSCVVAAVKIANNAAGFTAPNSSAGLAAREALGELQKSTLLFQASWKDASKKNGTTKEEKPKKNM